MILSPAKTLNLDGWDGITTVTTTEPSCNVDKTKELAMILKQKKKKDLKAMLNVSDKLADSVFQVRTFLATFEVRWLVGEQ